MPKRRSKSFLTRPLNQTKAAGRTKVKLESRSWSNLTSRERRTSFKPTSVSRGKAPRRPKQSGRDWRKSKPESRYKRWKICARNSKQTNRRHWMI